MKASVWVMVLAGSIFVASGCNAVENSTTQQSSTHSRTRLADAASVETTKASTPANAITPGEFFVERPTLLCLGFRWYISGDDNRNAQVLVSYRKADEKTWHEALPLLRIKGEVGMPKSDEEWTAPNMFAGSVLNLQPDTNYEVKLALSDPDGGKAERSEKLKTRAEPKAFNGGKTVHVYPQAYSGKKTEPSFTGAKGVQAAYEKAQPGDIILLHAGEYSVPEAEQKDRIAFTFDKDGTEQKPIVLRGAGDGEVILDGDGALRLIDCRDADYNYFENLTLRDADHLLYAGYDDKGSTGLVVRGCKLEDAGFPIWGLDAHCRDFYIADNTFSGPAKEWTPRKHSDEAYGQTHALWLMGQGHVVCYNRIDSFWDGIDFFGGKPNDDPKLQNAASDFYNNLLSRFADDGIEMDYGVHNIRVFNNFIYNTFMGISAQPIYGGPGYIFRNVVYNSTRSPIKPNQQSAGLLVFNNTFIAHGSAGRMAAIWQNSQFFNNLFMGSKGGEEGVIWTGTISPETSKLDYNGWRFYDPEKTPIYWHSSVPFKSPNSGTPQQESTFKDLADFSEYTGHEKHGVVVDYEIFQQIVAPSGDEKELPPLKLVLVQNSKAVDAGLVLPNITDGFTGQAPDLGAYELGSTPPHYGPRQR